VHAVRRIEMEAAGHGDDGHWRSGVGASVRRDTNAARRAGVPDGLAKMTPSGRGRKKIGPRTVPRGPIDELERRGFFEAQSKL
jgi:hypothetical protein